MANKIPPVRGKDKVPLDLTVRGQTGLPVYAGRVYDEILPELEGERGRRAFREMSEQDPIIGGILFGIEMLGRQVPWTVKPADDTALALRIADFVDECLTDMYPSWESTLSEILSMLTYGWSYLEIIYKRREGMKVDDELRSSRFSDGKVGWAGWSIRSQETLWRWEYEGDADKGKITGMTQLGPPDWQEHFIPYSKALHFTTRARRENPEGVSILRNAYRPWFMKKNIEVIEGIGIERDLAGLPVLSAPAELFSSGADDKQRALLASLQKIVTSIKRDEQEGILMPMAFDEDKNPLYKLELLATGGDRQFDTNAIVNRYNETMAMSMLADFILMGHQAVGSFALSSTKTGLFSTALGAILDILAVPINQRGIPKLVRLNGWPQSKSPTVEHGQVEAADMGKLGAFLKALTDAGMTVFPNADLEKYVLEQAGLPTTSIDQGAGEFPLPVRPGVAQPGLPGGAPRVLPGQQPLLPPGGTRPITRNRPVAGVPTPKTPTPTRPNAGPMRSASEKPKRFVPLGVRVRKVADELSSVLSSEEYSALLANVMEVGKFSKLEQEWQDAIQQAEDTHLTV